MNECSTERQSDRTFTERRALDAATVAELVALYPGRTSRELATLGGYCPMVFARHVPQTLGVSKGSVRACEVTGRRCLTWIPG